jgi:hypothetical protein
MSIKIFVSNDDRQKVARELLDAAPDPSHVRVEKMGGFGFIISDELAEKLGLAEEPDEDPVPWEQVKEGLRDLEKSETDKDSDTTPKRGRPRGKKSKGE